MSRVEQAAEAMLPLVGDALRWLRREWARRPDPTRGEELRGLSADIDEALAVLAQNEVGMAATVATAVKGLIARPAILRDPAAAQWIATPLAQDAIKQAIMALIRGEAEAPHAERACDHYEGFAALGGAEMPAARDAYQAARDFVLLSLKRDLSLGDRVILEALDGLSGRFDQIDAQRAIPAPHPALDADAAGQLLRLRQRRFFGSSNTAEEARALAARVLHEDYRACTPALRARILGWCARWLSASDVAAARELIAQARSLVSGRLAELELADAFIAAGEGQSGIDLIDIGASPLHATAALQLMRHGREPDEVLAQADRAGLAFTGFDADGRYVYIANAITADQWDRALDAVRLLEPQDYSDAPALLWISATILVAAPLAPELRPAVLSGLPIHPRRFPLPEDPEAVADRRLAATLIGDVARICRALDCPQEQRGAERFRLWLDLRDPEGFDQALPVLKELLRDPERAVAYLPLGLDYDPAIDRAEAARLIDRYLARNPAGDADSAMARLALILADADSAPREAYAMLTAYRDELAGHVDAAALLGFELQMLIDAGELPAARKRLDRDDATLLPAGARRYFDSLMAAGDQPDTMSVLEEAYAAAPSLSLLADLLRHHAAQPMSERYWELARQFVLTTRKASDAAMVIDHLIAQHHPHLARQLVDELGGLVDSSPPLVERAAFLDYQAGAIAQAEARLAHLEAVRDDPVDAQLRAQLLISTGRWAELGPLIEQQWSRRDARTPLDLLRFASLAQQYDSPRVRELIETAVARAPEDPQILAGAYHIATSAGLEREILGAESWIARAAERSGEDGPVQQFSLEDIQAEHPRWEARVEDAWRQLAAAQIPISVAALLLRRAWLEMHLVPMLANRDERDPRMRSVIPLFGAPERTTRFAEPLQAKPLAIDPSAIITLAVVGMLEEVLAAFPEIIIPHATLSDLYEQRGRLSFHQPSRIAFAHRLIHLLGRGVVQPFAPSTTPDPILLDEIAEPLAGLLTEVHAQSDGQHLLVCPYPITRAGSLSREPAKLGRFVGRQVGCTAVVDFLAGTWLTRREAEDARRYLKPRDGVWPDAPAIRAGATLYLSDLAVSYFRSTGLLDRLAEAGFVVIISSSEIADARGLISYEQRSEAVIALLDRTQRCLAQAIASGQIRLDQQMSEEHEGLPPLAGLARAATAVVCDDRFTNRHEAFDTGDGLVRLLSSLDLIAMLVADGRIERQRLEEILSELRRMGALFVPLEADELIARIAEAPLGAEGLEETTELRALRENIRLIQLRGWFSPAIDSHWLLPLQNAVCEALVAQWQAGGDGDAARARSDWLLRLLDMRDWAEHVDHNGGSGITLWGTILAFSKLLVAAFSLDDAELEAFGGWLEEEVLDPLWRAEPQLRDPFLNHLRGVIVRGDDDAPPGEPTRETRAQWRAGLAQFPRFLQLELVADDDFRRRLAVRVDGSVEVGFGETEFDRTIFFEAASTLYAAPGTSLDIADLSGALWQARAEADDGGWPILIEREDQRFRIRGLYGVHVEREARLQGFALATAQVGLTADETQSWCDMLAAAPLDYAQIDELNADLNDTPAVVAEAIALSIERGEARFSLLVPSTERYYQRLIGAAEVATLDDYVAQGPYWLGADVADDRGQDRIERLLLLGSHPQIVARLPMRDWDADRLGTLARWALDEGDILAKLVVVELALGMTGADAGLAALTRQLIDELVGLDPQESGGRLRYWSALIILVDGELSRNRVLGHWPPFRRRIAAIAQASLIERLSFAQVDRAELARLAMAERGSRFLAQSLVDLREEPRWRPDHIDPVQLRAELIGRIVNRAGLLDPAQIAPALREHILGETASLRQASGLNIYWAGPIEGAIRGDQMAPHPDMEALMAAELEAPDFSAERLIGLINMNGLAQIPVALVDRAVERIREAGPALFLETKPEAIDAILVGLGYVAASTRHGELAAQLARIVARQRQMPGADQDVHREIHLALIASAAHEDAAEWRTRLGRWLLDIAAATTEADQAEQTKAWLDTLYQIDPLLRATSGRAQASLNLLLGR